MILPSLLLASALAIKLGLILQDRLRVLTRETFSLFAVARGLPPHRILFAYRLLPAAGLVARFGALHAGHLLGGALVIETVFALPGLGRLAVLALTNRDVPLLRGCMLAAGGAYLMARLLADAAQSWLDPRPSAAS
jgi:peptide/nickel transport system permease protein